MVFKSPKYIIKILSSVSQAGVCGRFLLPPDCRKHKNQKDMDKRLSANDPNFYYSTPVSWNIGDMEREMCVKMSTNGFGPKFYGSYEYEGKN